MPDDHADAAHVLLDGRLGRIEHPSQYSRQDVDGIVGGKIVGIDHVGRHKPFLAIDRLVHLRRFPLFLEPVDGDNPIHKRGIRRHVKLRIIGPA